MRTGEVRDAHRVSDLTARARIRDAAIHCFAEEGFDAPFRRIAARAGVSPGLITHHFGSKAVLRAACDTEVLHRYRQGKQDSIAHPSARDFLDRLIDDARAVMADSVASGLVRPSRDEEARLRHLIHQAIGEMLVRFVTMPGLTPEEFVAALQSRQADSILPTLELLTEGLFADRQLLDDYLAYRDGCAAPAALEAPA